MTQIERLRADYEAALARPNPPIPLTEPRGTAAEMRGRGATHRIDRYGFGGAWVGYDYLAADGRLVASTMAACGNPKAA